MANGLKVLVLPAPGSRVVSVHVWIHAGSAAENPGKTGVAHLLEHLMFKGTANRSAGEFDRLIESKGGSTNAATWVDWTCYHQTAPAGALDLLLELEADRLSGLAISESQFLSELDVVRSERRLEVDDSPEGRISERAASLVFGGHPYAHPTIGYAVDLAGLTLADIRDFYREHYHPGNITLVISGDITPETAFPRAEKWFGVLPGAGGRMLRAAVPPGPVKPVESILELPAEMTRFELAWWVPGFRDPLQTVADVAAEILGAGEASRLYQTLVTDEELLQELDVSVTPWLHAAVLDIDAVVREGVDWRAARERIEEELRAIASGGLREGEMERAINRMDADHVRSLKNCDSRAWTFGFFDVMTGDPAEVLREPEKLHRVIAGDVRAFVAEWLNPGRQVCVAGIPSGDPGANG
ncbi:MAG: putative zinc protease [Myxococcota bacterium]|nr:putative zinc protease [Myxococcota bacterium]